jgi:cytoskeletal protein CcmA (bactofilin family)
MALFGKHKALQEKDGGPAQATSPEGSGGRGEGSRGEAKNAVIGPQVRIQGELSGDEDILVEGKVDGKISMTKTIRIGPSAEIHADVKAQFIVVAGKVVGNLVADRVEIVASGSVEGNIRSPKISIAEGAQFKGSVDMGGGKISLSEGGKGPMAPPASKPA